MKDLYHGKLVRLAAESPEFLSQSSIRWDRDTEFHRLVDSDPAQLWSQKKIKEWMEKYMEDDPLDAIRFSIRTLTDDKLIGFLVLRPDWVHADAWVGIGIGERDYWGKGYGTDAMCLLLQYAFLEANLRRVTLALHSYNLRALKSYEKVGFKVEGVLRGDTLREGNRTDGIHMGILREEWLSKNLSL